MEKAKGGREKDEGGVGGNIRREEKGREEGGEADKGGNGKAGARFANVDLCPKKNESAKTLLAFEIKLG